MINIHILDNNGTKVSSFYPSKEGYFGLTWESNLNKNGACEFSIDLFNSKATNKILKPFNTVLINKQLDDGTESTQWIGKIVGLDKKGNSITVRSIDLMSFMEYRIVKNAYGGSRTIASAINAIYNEINSRYPLPFSLGTISTSKNTFVCIPAGTSMLKALQDLADEEDKEFVIRYNSSNQLVLDFVDRIGSDSDLVFALEYTNPQRRDITKYDCEIDFTQFANFLYMKGSSASTTSKDNNSITEYGQIEKSISYESTGLSLQGFADSKLSQTKVKKLIPKIDINEQTYGIEYYKLGDTPRVVINQQNEIFNLDERLKITQLKVKVENDHVTPDLTLSLGKDQVITITDRLNSLNARIKTRELL